MMFQHAAARHGPKASFFFFLFRVIRTEKTGPAYNYISILCESGPVKQKASCVHLENLRLMLFVSRPLPSDRFPARMLV